jgi:hypothetical protein
LEKLHRLGVVETHAGSMSDSVLSMRLREFEPETAISASDQDAWHRILLSGRRPDRLTKRFNLIDWPTMACV